MRWGGDVKTHIAKMKELWSIVPEKPEWLSWQEILWFEKAMTDNENIVFVNWMMRYDMRDLGIFTENELEKLMKFQWFFVKDAAFKNIAGRYRIKIVPKGRVAEIVLSKAKNKL